MARCGTPQLGDPLLGHAAVDSRPRDERIGPGLGGDADRVDGDATVDLHGLKLSGLLAWWFWLCLLYTSRCV